MKNIIESKDDGFYLSLDFIDKIGDIGCNGHYRVYLKNSEYIILCDPLYSKSDFLVSMSRKDLVDAWESYLNDII